MNDEFMKHILDRGEKGKLWLKRIPAIIAEYEEKWSIKVSEPFNLTWNYVAPATAADGTKVVIKIGFPDDREFKAGIDALSVFNAEGIEKLIETDRENAVILTEQVIPGIPLSTLVDDEKATRILATVMKKLWKALPEKHNFITIPEWSKAITKFKEKYKTTSNLPLYLVDKAEYLFEELIANSAKQMLVHGDLHQNNVLSSNRDEWLAIDPKGVAAEPAYETGTMIRDPFKRMKNNPDMKKIITQRIHTLSDELGFNPQRIHKWAFAQTVLSAVWSAEDKDKRWKYTISIAEALNDIKI